MPPLEARTLELLDTAIHALGLLLHIPGVCNNFFMPMVRGGTTSPNMDSSKGAI